MTEVKQRLAANAFSKYWKGKGYEKGESQPFWISLLSDVFDVKHPEQFISFEDQVHIDNTSFIDGSIEMTHVLIEQKSIDKNLNTPIKQSDGTRITPFQQAKRYAAELPYSKRPRWIVTCNFKEFYIYDMERPSGDPEIVKLEDLEKEYYRLKFLFDVGDENIKKEMEISLKAGELVGILYDAMLKRYRDPENSETLKSLNAFCVRLVFCLYAEDADIFGSHSCFHDYLKKHRSEDRVAFINLFKVLDTKPEQRDPYLDNDLAAFPYVNGGLFADENIEIPRLGDEIIDLILKNASENFDWSAISPTIFGAVFESTLNSETRRSGGMHYTSIENIHKVIDPLFLDSLKEEFFEIKSITITKTRNTRLQAFQIKLASLNFLDPACGSGNFLTETYLSLRRLENEAFSLLHSGQIKLDYGNPIQVSIGQFYGIEINDFAVSVAKTALWIAESQMMKETEVVVAMSLDFLPLKFYEHNIVEGNALRIDWDNVIPKHNLSYIMGNPPFVGTKYESAQQKEDIESVCRELRALDYVTGWYKKASDFIFDTNIQCAFVSTNSVTQGEQVAILWKNMNAQINFAHRTFRWDSEANNKAHVHCVIIGFSQLPSSHEKFIFVGNRRSIAKNINGYLMDAPNILVETRSKPLCSEAPKMSKGSQPTDGGHLLLDENEKMELIKNNPEIEKYIKRYMGAVDLINNTLRYCLWLKESHPHEIRKMPDVIRRLELVKNNRLASKKEATRKWADKPVLFTEDRQPNADYLILPVVSSERRRYMPICYVSKDVIANTNAQMIPNGDLYVFGILMSNVHNSWMRTVCGRMKSDYAYSVSIVYNNFPWPVPTDVQKAKIKETAQAILDARAIYTDSSLTDLYDELTMPSELRKTHQANDRAVMEAYGFWGKLNSESECVAELMKMYQKLVDDR